jgi:hypothetical protein
MIRSGYFVKISRVRRGWRPSCPSRARFDHDVGKLLQRLFDEVQVLRPAAKMQRDKRGMRLLGEHPIALRQQLPQGRKLWAVEAPIRMFDEFLVAFVAGVDRMKKCFRLVKRLHGIISFSTSVHATDSAIIQLESQK